MLGVQMLSHCGLPLTLLLLLLLANGAPVVLGLLFGAAAGPVDGGRVWRDGRPVFGRSKTWRGVAAALVLTPAAAWILGCGWRLGLTIALAAMAGDLLASFIKRRLGLASSASVPVFDQLPETLLPALLVGEAMGLDWVDLGLAIGAFVVLDLVLTPVGKRLAGRRRG
jgi:hypothetical protein